MTLPPDMQLLAESFARFRATRSAYQSSSDQALTQLLASLAEEVLALRSLSQTGMPQAADVLALQAQLAALQSAYDAQQSELAQLRALVERTKVAVGRDAPKLVTRRDPATLLRHEPVVSPPRIMRSMDYWEQHVPDYGDATTAAELAATRSRRRVRPEDVVLTDEEQARLRRRWQSEPVPWGCILLVLAPVFLMILYILIRTVV